jgi:hypothetical protein
MVAAQIPERHGELNLWRKITIWLLDDRVLQRADSVDLDSHDIANACQVRPSIWNPHSLIRHPRLSGR